MCCVHCSWGEKSPREVGKSVSSSVGIYWCCWASSMLKESQNKTNMTAVRIGMIKQTSWSAFVFKPKRKSWDSGPAGGQVDIAAYLIWKVNVGVSIWDSVWWTEPQNVPEIFTENSRILCFVTRSILQIMLRNRPDFQSLLMLLR